MGCAEGLIFFVIGFRVQGHRAGVSTIRGTFGIYILGFLCLWKQPYVDLGSWLRVKSLFGYGTTLEAQPYWVPVLKSLYKFRLSITQRPTIWVPGLLEPPRNYKRQLSS